MLKMCLVQWKLPLNSAINFKAQKYVKAVDCHEVVRLEFRQFSLVDDKPG